MHAISTVASGIKLREAHVSTNARRAVFLLIFAVTYIFPAYLGTSSQLKVMVSVSPYFCTTLGVVVVADAQCSCVCG